MLVKELLNIWIWFRLHVTKPFYSDLSPTENNPVWHNQTGPKLLRTGLWGSSAKVQC